MKPQIIKTDGGDLVVLPRAEYEALRAHARAASDEDGGTARIVDRSRAALRAGREVMLPSDVAKAIANGESPLRVIRKWRGLTQTQLGSEKTSIGQSTVAALERGRRHGTAEQWRQLAGALNVSLDLLMLEEPDHRSPRRAGKW